MEEPRRQAQADEVRCIASMFAADRVVVVVPTYNERENLAAVVSRTLEIGGLKILIVDDDSPDGTGALADSLSASDPSRVAVLHRPADRGLGRAYLDGFRAALQAGAEVVCQMDADGSHDPHDLPPLLSALETADLVIGSRYVSGARVYDWPLSRRLLSRAGNIYVRLITGLRVRDVTAGFRAWRRHALLRMPLDSIQSSGHGFQVEITHAATQLDLRIAEIPISFRDRKQGHSKVSPEIFFESLRCPWRLIAGNGARVSPPTQS